MSTALQDLRTYWSGNATLTAAIPVSRIYTSIIPKAVTTYPFLVVYLISSTPTWQTSTPTWEVNTLQLSIFHTSLSGLETLIGTITGVLDWANISSGVQSKGRRTHYIEEAEGTLANTIVYQAILEYDFKYDR